MTDYLPAVLNMLGSPPNHHADPSAWDRLHAEFGIRLPDDYRTLVDAYAPVQVNGHLYLLHPATARWNLIDWMQRTVRAWSEIAWDDDLAPDEDPRLLFDLPELSFGTRDGLWPITSTDRGETLFLTASAGVVATSGIVVDDGDGGWARYDMPFAEWLHRYLLGADMAGPDSSALRPGPVRFSRLL